MKRQIILASKSPWRKRLLARNGIECRIHASNFVELKKHKDPRALVVFNARGKATEVARHYSNAIVVGVDTIGVLGARIIGKPKNRKDAAKIIMSLAGKTHRVISGLCVIDTARGKKTTKVVATKITFKKITPDELRRYLDLNQWKGKAGAYAIQGVAKRFVRKIDGDVTNVVGIPIEALKKILL